METQKMRFGVLGKGVRLLSSQGLLIATAGLVVASSAIVGSGTLAGFQAQTTNPGNVFNAGILRMTNVASSGLGVNSDCTTDGTTGGVLSGACKTLISTSLRVPGDATSNTVQIANVGNVDGLLTLGLSSISAANAATPGGNVPACVNTGSYPAQVAVTLKEDGATIKSGTLASLSGTNLISSKVYAPSASHTYSLGLAFTDTTDNGFQNCAVSPFTLTWTLDQRAASTTGAPDASGANA